ncbi:MAG: hypothetical protein V1645_01455 [archaeon]
MMNTDVQEGGFKCVCVKDAPLKVNLMWPHGIIQRVSGKRDRRHKTVLVRLLRGWSPNGAKEFELNETEKVNVLSPKQPKKRSKAKHK